MYRLREIERRDVSTINRWRNDEDLIGCLGAPFRYINPDVDAKWYEQYLSGRGSAVRCAIVGEDDLIIGMISLVSIDNVNRSAELHIMIGDAANRHDGAGTFAVRTILRHAFRNLNLHRVELSVLQTNDRAIRFYEKLGFSYEGTKRKARFKQGQYVDLLLYSMLESEYTEDRQPR